jgi:hypothetical protein
MIIRRTLDNAARREDAGRLCPAIGISAELSFGLHAPAFRLKPSGGSVGRRSSGDLRPGERRVIDAGSYTCKVMGLGGE